MKKGKRLLAAALLCGGAVLFASAQEIRIISAETSLSTDLKKAFTLKRIAKDFLKDAGEIWSYPAHIESRDILPISALAAATGFLMTQDEDIYAAFADYGENHEWVDNISPIITEMGGWGAWATAGLFYGSGFIFKDHRAQDTGILAMSAMIQTKMLVWVLKGLTGRRRPFVAEGVDDWAGPRVFFKRLGKGEYRSYDSFPSGHTSTAFSLATVVAMQYRKTVWVPVTAYTIAAAVGLSRITEDRHWMSDVLVGAVLGHLIGRLVVRNHHKRHHVVPIVGAGGGRIVFGIAFSPGRQE